MTVCMGFEHLYTLRPFARRRSRIDLVPLVACLSFVCVTSLAHAVGSPGVVEVHDAQRQWLEEYCSRCHNDERLSGDLTLTELATTDVAAGRNLAVWEKILRMTSRGEMPPRDRPQPTAETRAVFTKWLATSLDDHAAANPDPGRATLRRLNRSEYANAVRELLAIDVDVSRALPADDTGYGFDNIADVLNVSPTLMDRYLSVAGRVSRLAVGGGHDKPFVTTYLVPKDGSILNQGIPSWDERADDALPLDSRGGSSFRYYAPQDGVYQVSAWLNTNTNNEVDRLREARVQLRVPLTAGSHAVGVTFRRQLALDESVQKLHNDLDYVVLPVKAPESLPLEFVVDGATAGSTTVPSYFMSPRFSQDNWPRDVLQIDVEGPFGAKGPGDTPSRRKIFQCRPAKPAAEASCARLILASLARQAWRRPAVQPADIEPLMRVFSSARTDGSFEQGIGVALEALLVSPGFLFLREQDPPGSTPGSVHPLNDVDFAARLALFLWSSPPDEELLSLAAQGRLQQPDVVATQVARMLADPRAQALTQNFAGQWLYLRNLEHHRPDVLLFPQFNTRLRDAMRRETELFFGAVIRENRSVLEFIESDYTFLNERLARLYGIDGVRGPAFRRVALAPNSQRGGLLGQASVLTVTSYANHTSVVKRGQWVLTNLLSAPPPPPPPDIPALKSTLNGRVLTAREQLELHREDEACAVCHSRMDPLGYALENFDAVGAYRTQENGHLLDVVATMPDGTRLDGLPSLRKTLLARKDVFTQAFSERLLTYALGRGVEPTDMPSVRAIARQAAQDNYRIHSLLLAIVKSDAFRLRRTPVT